MDVIEFRRTPKATPGYLHFIRFLGLMPFGHKTLERSSIWLIYSILLHVTCVILLTVFWYRANTNHNLTLSNWFFSLLDNLSVFFITAPHLFKLTTDRTFEIVAKCATRGEATKIHTEYYPLYMAVNLSVCFSLLSYQKPEISAAIYNAVSMFSNFASCLVMTLFCSVLDVLTVEIERLIPVLCVETVAVADKNLTLHKLLDVINSFFSPQLFLMCLKVFLSFTLGAYRFLNEQRPFLVQVCRLAVIGFNVVLILVVTNACEKCNLTAQAFNAELFRLMRKRDDLCYNKKLVLHVTMKQNVKFTACGFFTLGYPLITSIIAGATTYLVILMQLS